MSIRFDGRAAIVTGAGVGLGRAHALGLAARGAKVVVNDLGGALDGSGGSSATAEAVVDEIRRAGGEAVADGANVADFAQVEAMIARTKAAWGRIDVIVNNAGILRDKTFAKMELSDFKAVVDVHLMGAVNTCKAAWQTMRDQHYGRIVLTSSSSGLYGNFGQANYGAAKMAVIGLMNVLQAEGAKYGIRVNALAPSAATRMTEGLISDEMWGLLQPEAITPGLLYLVCEDAPERTILCAGAGAFAVTQISETQGLYFAPEDRTPETIARRFAEIRSPTGARIVEQGAEQTLKFVKMALEGGAVAA